MDLHTRIAAPGPKKLLAIDGGGIRGVLALEVLAGLEAMLRRESGKPSLVLSDYFDYIAGTSTGAIIAASLSLGLSVDGVLDFYLSAGPKMFRRANLARRYLFSRYVSGPLANELRKVLGQETTLGSRRLRTLLLLVLRNATTDSPWPLSNNPYAKYNDPKHPGCNLGLPLWQLVRASTAAPTYFPPEKILIEGQEFLFVDGGVTMYNNPAFQTFLMATLDRYWPQAPSGLRNGWPTGVENLLLVSVGTGTSPGVREKLTPRSMHTLFNAKGVPAALMFAALIEQDFLCRVFGDCLLGPRLDSEVDDLKGCQGPAAPKLFTYLRYNADLTATGLADLGLPGIRPRAVQELDSIASLDELRQVGRAVAEREIRAAHFDPFPP